MYTREEASALRKAFWTAFGQYMAPVLSAEGERVSWLNYKTGEKHVYFRMQAEGKGATIAIEMAHPDSGIRQLYYEQFRQLEGLLADALQEAWTWELMGTEENGKVSSRIYRDLPGVSVFRKEDWPALISFFKPRIMALDRFWSEARYGFEALH